MQNTNERGQFFDPSLCPFGYNETIAQEYFPVDKVTAENIWFTRLDYEHPINLPTNADSIDGSSLPASIITIEDDIIQKIIICTQTRKPFRITKEELQLYRTMHIPIPRVHPDVRHAERLANKPQRKLYLRNCDKTGEQILSSYPADTPFKVYSQRAYEQEIYW